VDSLKHSSLLGLAAGKRVAAEGVLYAMGRQGNTDTLNMGSVGVKPDKRGLLDVNGFYQVRG
jgi:NAD(P) transhydrogenase